jgi:hypothetical protein
MTVDFQKATAELDVLRGFIDFVNNQVGVYMDCLSGFEGNQVRIHRQVARVQRRTGQRIENGQPVMMYASIEDPRLPDVIHHRIIRSDNFISVNAERGFNEQQVCWSIIVFMFAFWDEQVRPQIAQIRGVEPGKVTVDALGDLRLIRNSIIHNKGVISASDRGKLKKMKELVIAEERVSLSHDQMHKLFVLIKQAIGAIILEYTGHLPGAPNPSEIVGVAIQTGGPSRKA